MGTTDLQAVPKYTAAEERAIVRRATTLERRIGLSRSIAEEIAEAELEHGLLKAQS